MAESVPWTLPCWRPSASTLTSCTSTTARSVSRRSPCARPPPRGASAPSATRTASTASRSAGWWRRRGSARPAFLGVDPSRAAWVRNVSEGVSAVLGSLELRPGDELVTSTHGYGAVRKALRPPRGARRGAGRRGGLSRRRRRRRDRRRRTPPPARPAPGWSWSTGSPRRPPPCVPVAAVAAAAAGAGARGACRRRARARAAARRHRRARRRPLGRQPAQVGLHAARQRDLVEPAGSRRDARRAQLAAGRRVRRVVRLPRHLGLRRLAGGRRTAWRTGRRWAAGTPWPGSPPWPADGQKRVAEALGVSA